MDHVWDAIRDQQCNDLFFYYDYRRLVGARSEQLAVTIARGNYRPKAGLAIAITKADLLARNMHIPHPDDALVLQVISETLLPLVEKKKPSANAFFARSHQEHHGLHKQDQLKIYPWFTLWPKYQENILNFAKTKKFLVITDVLNFFDSVSFSQIRRRVQDEVASSQQVVDLMLLLFENFIRRNMYAPIVLHGIPTIDIDAPRLVGHGLLFPVDEYLKKSTGKCFARWMDDINFGVDSIREARERIRDIDAILRQMGLRLSGGKTKILSFEEARLYLQADENQRLNVIETQLKKGKLSLVAANSVCRGLAVFRLHPRIGYWDKVMRRYYGLVARINARLAYKSKNFRKLLRKVELVSRIDFDKVATSEYRESIIKLWATLPATKTRIATYLKAFEEVSFYDDAVAFSLGRMLSSLQLSRSQVKAVISSLLLLAGKANSAGYFFSAAWFLGTHGSKSEIESFILKTKLQWEANYVFARQVVALWSILPESSAPAKELRALMLGTFDPEIRGTIEFVEGLRTVVFPDASLRGTLPFNKALKSCDLRRAIISSNVMRSSTLDPSFRSANAQRINSLINDRNVRTLALGGVAV